MLGSMKRLQAIPPKNQEKSKWESWQVCNTELGGSRGMQNAAGMRSNPSRAGSRQALQALGRQALQVGQGGIARQCCRMMLLPPVVTPLDTAEYRECVRNVPIQSKMCACKKRRAGSAAASGNALLPPAKSCSLEKKSKVGSVAAGKGSWKTTILSRIRGSKETPSLSCNCKRRITGLR